jgi:hypothetical protein
MLACCTELKDRPTSQLWNEYSRMYVLYFLRPRVAVNVVAGRLAVAADLLSGALQPTPRGTAAYRTLRERHCCLFAVLPSKPRGCNVFCLQSWYLGAEAWLISHQPAVLFSHKEPATSNQPALLFSQNKPAPAISHQPTEQADNSGIR